MEEKNLKRVDGSFKATKLQRSHLFLLNRHDRENGGKRSFVSGGCYVRSKNK